MAQSRKGKIVVRVGWSVCNQGWRDWSTFEMWRLWR